MIYLDSSAIVKLLIKEPETLSLERWFAPRSRPQVVSSQLAKVEVIRTVRRASPESLDAARVLIARVDLLPIDRIIVDAAADIDRRSLRSLDAIHLATALSVRDALTDMVVYDRRLFDAAAQVGLNPVSPGAQ